MSDETLKNSITTKAQHLRLSDGRLLAYTEYGDVEGRPLFYCHGFPCSRLEAAMIDQIARELGLRVISPDRPGYGESDFQKQRSLLDWPQDISQLADALGIERFTILGVSGGGPYTLACAKMIPDRIKEATVVCGLGPATTAEQTKDMHLFARFTFRFAACWPRQMSWVYRNIVGRLLQHKPEAVMKLVALSCPAVDRKTLAGGHLIEILTLAIREAFTQGTRGPVHDLLIYTSSWGFSLQDIQTAVSVWHGEDDATVPVSFAKTYQEEIPRCQVRILPREGHYSLPVLRMKEILEKIN